MKPVDSVGQSAHPICEMLRTLAHGDSSVALVCAMQPRRAEFSGWPPHRRLRRLKRLGSSSDNRFSGRYARGPGGGPSLPSPASLGKSLRPRLRLDVGAQPALISSPARKTSAAGQGSPPTRPRWLFRRGRRPPDMFFLDLRKVMCWRSVSMVQILTSSRNSADAGAVSLSMLLSRPSGLPLRVPLSDSCDRGIGRPYIGTTATATVHCRSEPDPRCLDRAHDGTRSQRFCRPDPARCRILDPCHSLSS